jgi:hypothetical protein
MTPKTAMSTAATSAAFAFLGVACDGCPYAAGGDVSAGTTGELALQPRPVGAVPASTPRGTVPAIAAFLTGDDAIGASGIVADTPRGIDCVAGIDCGTAGAGADCGAVAITAVLPIGAGATTGTSGPVGEGLGKGADFICATISEGESNVAGIGWAFTASMRIVGPRAAVAGGAPSDGNVLKASGANGPVSDGTLATPPAAFGCALAIGAEGSRRVGSNDSLLVAPTLETPG